MRSSTTASVAQVQAACETMRDPRWPAVVTREAESDGRFVYSVSTTGVYCRPSCAARLARPEHVRFHATPAAAEQAGFRPCKRCRPHETSSQDRQARSVAEACRFIEQAEVPPSLNQVASRACLSPFHFHRLFKRIVGLTPREYAAACRERRVRDELRRRPTVTEAIMEAGYQSSGRFYARATKVLGMTPTAYRAGGEAETIGFAVGACSLGAILVAQSRRGICAILLGDDHEILLRELRDRFPRARLNGGNRRFEQLVAVVVGFVDLPRDKWSLPLDIRGTAFQRRVWDALQEIPPGQRMSYAELARQIGAPTAVRAVANACAANPLAVAIPCHRVVRSDGRLAGYRWGLARKRALLEQEAKS